MFRQCCLNVNDVTMAHVGIIKNYTLNFTLV